MGGVWGFCNSTYKNMPYRLDKSRSPLAEARLKINLYTVTLHLGEINYRGKETEFITVK